MKAKIQNFEFCFYTYISIRVFNFKVSVTSRRQIQIIDRDRQHKIDLHIHKELKYTSREYIHLMGIGIAPPTFTND